MPAVPVSTTTFQQRVARIEAGNTPHSEQLVKKTKKSRRKRSGLFSVPFLVGVGILTGGTAYAWFETQTDITWVMAFAG